MLRVFVITNDYYLWCLSPFSYLFNKYWSDKQEVVIMGFRPPKFELPNNFHFHSIARANYPQKKWSNALIEFLKAMSDEHCVLMLEDYWISRPVDTRCITSLHQFMIARPDVLRFDLSIDVLHTNGDSRDATDIGFIGPYDIVEKPHGKPYRMSFQAGLWNTKLLLSLLKEDKDPWEVEIQTSPPSDMKVLGTRQWPLRYINAIYKGELDTAEINKLHKIDLDKVKVAYPKEIPIRNYNKENKSA